MSVKSIFLFIVQVLYIVSVVQCKPQCLKPILPKDDYQYIGRPYSNNYRADYDLPPHNPHPYPHYPPHHHHHQHHPHCAYPPHQIPYDGINGNFMSGDAPPTEPTTTVTESTTTESTTVVTTPTTTSTTEVPTTPSTTPVETTTPHILPCGGKHKPYHPYDHYDPYNRHDDYAPYDPYAAPLPPYKPPYNPYPHCPRCGPVPCSCKKEPPCHHNPSPYVPPYLKK